MDIYVKPVNVYGTELYKPVNDAAHLFALLAGTKNLTSRDLSIIEQLGYKLTQVTTLNSLKLA